MKGFLRFIFVFAGCGWILSGIIVLGIGKSTIHNEPFSFLESIGLIIYVLIVAMVFFLIGAWIKKGKAFDIKNDGLSILLKEVIIFLALAIYLILNNFYKLLTGS